MNYNVLNIQSWDDVNRLDVRPGRGVVKAWLMNGYEVQVDLGTGRVMQTAYVDQRPLDVVGAVFRQAREKSSREGRLGRRRRRLR